MGDNTADIHQITRITEILGSPSDDDIANIKSEPAKKFLLQLGKRPGIPFSVLFPNANPLGACGGVLCIRTITLWLTALDLLFRMLTFNPSKRITVEEAMAHPYLAFFHDPNDEVCSQHACKIPPFIHTTLPIADMPAAVQL